MARPGGRLGVPDESPTARRAGLWNRFVMGYFRWSAVSDQILSDHYSNGVFRNITASVLGCSHFAVTNRAMKLGLSHKYRNRSLEERFNSFYVVDEELKCWIWIGATDSGGYGQIRVKKNGPLSLLRASHLSLLLVGRDVPAGFFACHSCDNPRCVNPEHLFHGTQVDNMQDCKTKGRMSMPPVWKGERRAGRYYSGS